MSRRAVAAVALLLLAAASAARAQSSWDAVLDITAYPSPYLSDWEANPTIATLTITNPTAADQNVLLVYRVTDQGGRVVASGRSDPMLIVSGPPTVITDFVNLPGSSQHDQGFEDQMRRTGRLPEGDQTICVAVTDEGGFVLAEDCVTFSVVYPDPPYLLGPLDDAMLTSGNPVFQWTPLQVPPAFQLTYVLRISEVLDGQTPEQALVANIPLFETTALGASLEYPIGAPPLEEGKSYVWRVQALDQNGYAASANEGRSEVWTFRLGDPGGGGPVGGGELVSLNVMNLPAAAAGSAPTVPENNGEFYSRICSTWDSTRVTNYDTTKKVNLALRSPIGFPLRNNVKAKLFRYNVPGSSSRVWAIVGDHDTKDRRLLLYGDCDGPLGAVPWPKWMGVRTKGGSASTAFLMQGDTTHADTTYADTSSTRDTLRYLKFGVVIYTLEEQTAAAPSGFAAVRSFLEDHEIDLKAGVNAFGIWQLREGRLWKYFQALGYQNKELELQGFAGVGHHISVGFAGSTETGKGGADASAELEFVNLRAALPSRVPVFLQGLFASMHLELELVVTDTVSRGLTPEDQVHHQFHLILNVKHRIALSDGVITALRMNKGAEFVNSMGLDLSTEEFNRGSTELKFVQKYTLDASWRLGQTQFVVGHPELEIDVGLIGEHAGDITFTLSGAAGWGTEESVGKIALTLGKSAAMARSRDRGLSDERIARWQDRLTFTEGELAKATTDAEKEKLRGYIEQYRRWIETERVTIEMARDTTLARSIRETVASEPKCFKLQGWYCSFRLSFGNMGVKDLLSFIREIGFAAAN